MTTGPQCPVVQVGSPCPDAPWEGKINVTSDGFVTTTPTSADGRFSIALEPGTYTVLPFVSGPTSAEPVTVVVEAHRYAEVTLTVDTGIR